MFRTMARVCALALAGGSLAQADSIRSLISYDSYGSTGGGEFLTIADDLGFVSPAIGPGPAGSFETFCLEKTESITFGITNYYKLGSSAVEGGGGSVGGEDPLDRLTAYLYERFITGSLAGYTYSLAGGDAARIASADALQHVMWYIEDEEPISWTPGDASLMDLFYADALANAAADIGDVRVMNVYADEAGTQNVQDQLVLTPEPGTAVLCLMGAALMAARRRG